MACNTKGLHTYACYHCVFKLIQWIKYLWGAAKLCFTSFTLSSEYTYVNQSSAEPQSCKSKTGIHISLHLDYVDSLWTNITTPNLYFILLGFLFSSKNFEAVSARFQTLYLKAENTPFYYALLSWSCFLFLQLFPTKLKYYMCN